MTFIIYYPGLTGKFLFDDYDNLNKLALYDPTASSLGFKQYLLSAARRPLPFLSFLLNDTSWPSNNAAGFLFTNLLFHLLSGILLIWLALKTALTLNIPKKEAEWIGILTGTFWLIHPLMVSTTLYIVQRITILSALFIFASLLSYTHGRLLLQTTNNKAGYLWMTFGVLFFAFISISSKEIAALIPCYLLLFETILFKKTVSSALFSRWKLMFIYLPVTLTVAFFLHLPFSFFWETYAVRNFDLAGRVLTEARVLIYYLSLLVLPKSQTFGLHYENIEISSGLFTPITTFFSLSLILILITSSIKIRKTHPVLAFSILFFFTGHLLESTIIPLEIYFEHRNYLPSCFLFFSLAYYLVQLYKLKKIAGIALLSSILIIFSGLTYSRASLWGNPLLMMSVWTETNPSSVRNYTEAALVADQSNRPDLVTYFLEEGKKNIPDDPYINLWYLQNNCYMDMVNQQDFDKLVQILKTTPKMKVFYIYKNLKVLVERFSAGKCPLLESHHIKQLINSALKNPHIIHDMRRQEMHHLLGLIALAENENSYALSQFKISFMELPLSGTALEQIALLATYKQYDLALQHIKYTKLILKNKNQFSNFDQFNFEDLEKRLMLAKDQ